MLNTIFQKMSLSLALISAVAVAGCSEASQAKSDTQALLTIQATDTPIGQADAPVTLIEYASMTCGHCARFHQEILPHLKEKYVDTGKAVFTMRPLPWDNRALAVSKLTVCAGDRYNQFVGAFFGTLMKWAAAEEPLPAMKQIAALGGMSGEEVEACLANEDVHAQVITSREQALNVLEVKSTPTLFVNGEPIVGVQPIETYIEAIEKNL